MTTVTQETAAPIPTEIVTRQVAWSITAAFGTYFCMYAFRKPFTAAGYTEFTAVSGVDFKTVLVTSQVAGYTISKFLGIKVVPEMPPARRALSILALIGLAELALLLFALTPAPWNAAFLFLNGLPLGIVFGLVMGCLEGRRQTELLTAGLCASFILADGTSKTLGKWLLDLGISTAWMPFSAGAVATVPLMAFVWMLSRIPPPAIEDVAARSMRSTMNRAERLGLYGRYAAGLTILVGMYLLVTIVRSIRADFAPEIWKGLGAQAVAETYTNSEIYVAAGVWAVNGATILIRNNRRAFFAALLTCTAGFVLIAAALIGQQLSVVSPFVFVVLTGLGLYLPYVAVHTTVFERLLAMTRERGTTGFLMYVADAFGYLGFVGVMLSKHLLVDKDGALTYFLAACWVTSIASLFGIVFVWRYFSKHPSATPEALGQEPTE